MTSMNKVSSLKVKQKYEAELMKMSGVVGVGISSDKGQPCILVMTSEENSTLKELSKKGLDGVSVKLQNIGDVKAL